MKRYQLIGALTAFMITFILCTVFNSCTVKAGAKTKGRETKTEKSEATEGARPLAGLSLVLQKAAEKNVDVFKIIMEQRQQELEEINLLAEDIYRNGTPEVPGNVLYQATFEQGEIWDELNGEIFCYG